MECVICGEKAKKVREKRRAVYRKESVVVQTEFYRCGSCDESFYTPAQAKEHVKVVKNEIRKVKGRLAPEKIAAIRKRLRLSQADLEQVLNIGQKTVVRWESGKVIQGVSHDNILRMLDRHPELLAELREVNETRSEERKEHLAHAI